MRAYGLIRRQLYLSVLLLYLTRSWDARAETSVKACNAAAGAGLQLIEQDCVLAAAAPAGSLIKGRLGTPGGPPALIFGENSSVGQTAAATGTTASIQLEYVVLSGYRLPDPSSPVGLIPVGLVPGSSGSVVLRDVRILVDSATLQQHVQYFAGLPGTRMYTDGSSFLHVNWHASSRVSWQSVGLLLATGLQEARATDRPISRISSPSIAAANSSSGLTLPAASTPAPKYSYVLAATNSTLVSLMQELGAAQGDAAMILYVDTNITLSKPPVPQSGIVVKRPCILVGLVTAVVSLDLHMTVNSIIMTAPSASLTVDSLAVENMAPGDAKSAEVARPLSVSSANNFWALYYDRRVNKLLIRNCTCVLGTRTELDYYLYWATVYHSSLPYFKEMAKFVREVIGVSKWEIKDAGDNSVIVVDQEAGSCNVQDTLYTIHHVAAPEMQSPPLDPRLQLQLSQKSPLVTAVTTDKDFREQLQPLSSSEQGRTHVVLLLTNISVSPAGEEGSAVQQGNVTVAPGGIPVPGALTLLGDASDKEPTSLNLGWRRDLLALPGNAAANHLQVQHLVLQGLAQGPGATGASRLDSPDVWTILLWAVQRTTASSVSLAACMLELPAPELEQIRQLSEEGQGQIVLKLAGDITVGDGLLVLNDVRPSSSSSGAEVYVGSLTGQGLNGTNLTLVSTQAAAVIPGGYHWPGGGIHSVIDRQSGQLSSTVLAVAIAVPIAVAAIIAAAILVLLLSRQKKQWQQDAEKAQAAQCDDQLLPELQHSSISHCAFSKPNSRGGTQSGSIKESSYDTVRPLDQQQLQQHGLELLRAWPHGALCAQSTSTPHASGQRISPGISAAWVEHQPSGSGDTAGSSGQGCQQHSLSELLDLQRAQQAAESVGCCIDESPKGQVSADAGGSKTQVQKQQQQGIVISQTLFHSAGGNSLALVAEHMQQTAPHQQGMVLAGASPGQQTRSDSASSTVAAEQQQQQQQRKPERKTSSQRTEPGAKPTSSGAKSDGAGSGGGLPPAAAAPKPWQRISTAISLLQHGITVRRLEAGLADSRACSVENSTACGDMSVACGHSCNGGSVHKQQQHQDTIQRVNSIPQQIQLLDMIGRGSFASVYRAIWRGRCVAVKVVHLPGDAACADGEAGGDCLAAALQTRERMAVMEAVISVTMSHPNIVQVFTFALKPLPTALGGSSAVAQQLQGMPGQADGRPSGWELQLVMEYCKEGSLRQALNQGRFTDSSTGLPALHMVLALAHDIACAMLHLHSENLIHADLKASNVLLTKGMTHIALAHDVNSSKEAAAAYALGGGLDAAVSVGIDRSSSSSRLSCAALLELSQASEGGRLIAKVADFGLSLSLNPGDTHVSHMHAGTLTHMAPELLLHGRASAASDVYAFGILLWELLTGRRAFLGVPVALLGHNVVHLRWRPGWVQGVPAALKLLVEQSWAQEASARPTFQDILVCLEQLMQLSPEQLHQPASFAEQCQQQQLQQAAAATTPSTLAGQQSEQQQWHVQQPQQQERQHMQLQGEHVQQQQAASESVGAGAAGDDLTGAWSLPGGKKTRLGSDNVSLLAAVSLLAVWWQGLTRNTVQITDGY